MVLSKVKVQDMDIDYLSFGNGTKNLILIQGLNTRGIKGAGPSLAYMYRTFTKDYKVYLFDRRPIVHEGITVRDLAQDIAEAMDVLGIQNADVFGCLCKTISPIFTNVDNIAKAKGCGSIYHFGEFLPYL